MNPQVEKRAAARAAERLRSRAGESIAEVLVALLIASLALLMLAGMINTSARLIARSRISVDNIVKEENALTARESGTEGTVTWTLDGSSVALTKDDDGEILYRVSDSDLVPGKKIVTYWAVTEEGP